jgi:hypothetical protein
MSFYYGFWSRDNDFTWNWFGTIVFLLVGFAYFFQSFQLLGALGSWYSAGTDAGSGFWMGFLYVLALFGCGALSFAGIYLSLQTWKAVQRELWKYKPMSFDHHRRPLI